jgi:hypothetical protein
MAKKKGGLGRFIGGLAGRPYDRLLARLEKLVVENEGSALSAELDKLATVVQRTHEQGQIDDDDHDLLIEEIEEVHPDGRRFQKFGEDDEFYDDEVMPDAPELQMGGEVNLDELMKTKTDSFVGSYGRDEFEEYRQQMAEDFFKESDEAIAAGDHYEVSAQDPSHRTFHDIEEDAAETKRRIAEEAGADGEGEDKDGKDETYRVDDDGTEWWQDEDSQWWYRPKGEEDWFPWDN